MPVTENNQKTIELNIDGMTCASCVFRVEKSLKKLEGVQNATVNLATETATIQGNVTENDVIGAVLNAGYKATIINTHSNKNQASDKENHLRNEKRLLMISVLLTLPLVIPMLLQPFGIDIMLPGLVQLALALPVQIGIGARFYKAGWSALKARTGNMDLLVAIGTTAAFGLSLYLLFKKNDHATHGLQHLYFESSSVIITLVVLGKYLESIAKQQTTEAIKSLQKMRPETAVIIKNGTEIEVPIEKLKLADLVIVRPGSRIPVDGLVKTGESQVDESLITGESMPVLKKVGDKVTGGSMNSDGVLTIQITALGAETVLSRIIRLVETAQQKKAPIQRLVDQVSAFFIPTVLLIAMATLISWGFITGDWEQAILNSVAVLVIACPCALGLATPTTIMVGTGLAAKSGILIKDAEALEITHSVNAIAFDKTGTLTEGHPRLTHIFTDNVTQEELLTIASSLQSKSEHPLAKAVLEFAKNKNIKNEIVTNFRAIAGKGVEGQIQGRNYLIGTQRLLEEKNIRTDSFTKQIFENSDAGATMSFVADLENKTTVGLLLFNDQIKETAKETITTLKNWGITPVMITGDNWASAHKIANELGITNIHAEVLPGDKSSIVQNLRNKGSIVAMVGDGINDAPALAMANVGFAMSTGTDVAMHSAGITLMNGNPLLIANALEISKKTYLKIRQNLFWAFFYNVIGIPLAALGLLNPMLAGAAMAFSSVSVVMNALLLKRWKKHD